MNLYVAFPLFCFFSSECPDECQEAVASLIYAAARFADLPELRELRSLFTAKYGRSFEQFTNKEVVLCGSFLLIKTRFEGVSSFYIEMCFGLGSCFPF